MKRPISPRVRRGSRLPNFSILGPRNDQYLLIARSPLFHATSVIGKPSPASQHADQVGQVLVTAVESILQTVGRAQEIRHVAANSLIKQDWERRNRLRQR